MPRIDWGLVYLAVGYASCSIALCCLSGASLIAVIMLLADHRSGGRHA